MHCNSNTLGVHTLQLTPEALSHQEFPYFLCTKFTLRIIGVTFPVFSSRPHPPPTHMQYIICGREHSGFPYLTNSMFLLPQQSHVNLEASALAPIS